MVGNAIPQGDYLTDEMHEALQTTNKIDLQKRGGLLPTPRITMNTEGVS